MQKWDFEYYYHPLDHSCNLLLFLDFYKHDFRSKLRNQNVYSVSDYCDLFIGFGNFILLEIAKVNSNNRIIYYLALNKTFRLQSVLFSVFLLQLKHWLTPADAHYRCNAFFNLGVLFIYFSFVFIQSYRLDNNIKVITRTKYLWQFVFSLYILLICSMFLKL